MIEYDKMLPVWLVRLIFFRIDFTQKGNYRRKQFLLYNNYKVDYYDMMSDGARMHSLSNYFGIITVWYFKPN